MQNKDWKIPYKKPYVPQELLDAGCTPLLASILNLRGIKTADQAHALLNGGIEVLHDPFLMKDMNKAVSRIRKAIRRHEKTAVYGDYDVDGITATCVMTDYLRSKGIGCVSYIPDRNEEGYGLNKAAIDFLSRQGVKLIITVDCGITAKDEVAYAASLGIDMIITDHHECSADSFPDAVAVVDCKQDGDSYPTKYLAGVGVAVKLVCAVEDDTEGTLERYADLAAIGTVADVMPLVDENRFFVRRGIEKLISSPRPGIAAMLRESAIEPRKITASTIGFSLAPRLNAAGRLGRAVTAAQLLLTYDNVKASELAVELCNLNRQRQAIETEIWNEANALLAGTVPTAPIVLASDRWHQGVIGIAASRLSEQYSLPAIMICLNGEVGKGSCRSYGGFNLFEALSACGEHLIGFGGHALAAGLNIRSNKLDDFREALAEYYRNNKPEYVPEVQSDLLIADASLLSIENVASLEALEPFGNMNPKPVMCLCGVSLDVCTAVGNGKHLRMRVRLGRESFEAIFFSHIADELGIHEGDLIDLAFTPQINDFRGHVSVQLVVSAARKHDSRELCSLIMDGRTDCLWAAAAFRPERTDFIRVWRLIERPGFTVGMNIDEVISMCPAGMSHESFCICLAALAETGLLSSHDGRIYGSVVKKLPGKVNLEKTEIIRKLKRS